ncbi:M24 family metallopeptidase [archaeon]|nr:MAG: M24 family metallopeptidase [archaeon]
MRQAAEVHRQVRTYMHSVIQPGIKLADMCAMLEDMNRRLVKENGLKCGIAFPTGMVYGIWCMVYGVWYMVYGV